MNIFQHLEQIEHTKDRLKKNQNDILDIFEKGNADHIQLLKETCELLAEAERLEQEYKNLLTDQENQGF